MVRSARCSDNGERSFRLFTIHYSPFTSRHARLLRPLRLSRPAQLVVGTYSQAMRAGNTVYLSGQIPLDPATGEIELVEA